MPEETPEVPDDHIVLGDIISGDTEDHPGSAKKPRSARVATISPEARRRHLYVLGATGTGKTNLFLRLIESDIAHQRAFCVIDLRGDLVDRILPRLAETAPPAAWRERLLLIDLRHSEDIVGFNPLLGEGDVYNRALHILSVLKQQSESWGVQLEESLRNCLIALAEAGWSLLEIEPLLTN
ncbi:MAG: type IV secretion system DNA-binding domain-containing protein, partial [Abitibacteriaceae bacterium]|nr:type IV secretion system DNA-binding domain-containing protein [Abditibacteriaceae bacterium]